MPSDTDITMGVVGSAICVLAGVLGAWLLSRRAGNSGADTAEALAEMEAARIGQIIEAVVGGSDAALASNKKILVVTSKRVRGQLAALEHLVDLSERVLRNTDATAVIWSSCPAAFSISGSTHHNSREKLIAVTRGWNPELPL